VQVLFISRRALPATGRKLVFSCDNPPEQPITVPTAGRKSAEACCQPKPAIRDFIVCGSGSSGSAVARRLAENPEASVLMLEAGGSDDSPVS